MKKDYTKIVFVVDRSGSMGSIAKDIIGGYNKFIADQKSLNHGTADVSFYQFDTEYEAVYENTPLAFVKDLDDKTFVPRGGTALLDAVGRTIETVGTQLSNLTEENRPEKVLVVIITDGEENSSHKFNSAKVKELVTRQTDVYKWSFTYIGANQNAWSVGGGIGIASASNLTYAANAAGTLNAFASLGVATANYRSCAAANFEYSVDDIETQIGAGADIDLNAVKSTLKSKKTTAPATP